MNFLSSNGYEAIGADCGEEAWIEAAKQTPSLMVLDVLLPDMDGLSLCEMFRKIPQTANMPILMLTTCATLQVRGIADHAVASDFLTKPFSPRELAQRVERLLNGRPLRNVGRLPYFFPLHGGGEEILWWEGRFLFPIQFLNEL